MKKGFTLVEIMIVVAIIAILAAIAIPNFVKYRKESQQASCEQTRAQIVTAAENWGSKTANSEASTVTIATLAPTDGSGYFKNEPKCPDAAPSRSRRMKPRGRGSAPAASIPQRLRVVTKRRRSLDVVLRHKDYGGDGIRRPFRVDGCVPAA